MKWSQRTRFLCFIILVLSCFIIPLDVIYTNIVKKEHITQQITRHLKNENIRIEDDTAKIISQSVYEESTQHGLDYRLVLALMKIESNFKHNAVSSMGARGLLQVKPSVAKFIAQDAGIQWDGYKTLDEPDSNIKIGVFFFSQLLKDFKNTNLALKAYNMGPTKVKQLALNNKQASRGFSGLVMKEYKKNTSTFPDP
ncbi:MAG: soluble lytic murein transglycosylase [Deltaproteobacteria bacterium]|nr:soluble lytic murein transglycosylase [Deltaproteobacteria bacterium]